MADFSTRRDPTRPVAPAFTKLEPQVDIMERQRARKAKGGLMPPMMFAKMDEALANRRKR